MMAGARFWLSLWAPSLRRSTQGRSGPRPFDASGSFEQQYAAASSLEPGCCTPR